MNADIRHSVVAFSLALACTASAAVLAQQPPARPGPIATDARAVTVKLDDLEDKPGNYVGKTVTVEGEVDKLLGAHLFTIDERQWVDPAREMPVSLPAPFTADLKQDMPVRVTGTVERIPIDRLEREIGPIVDAKLREKIASQPVLVATAVVDPATGKSLLIRKGS